MMEPTRTRGGSQTKGQGNSLLNSKSAGWIHDDAAHFSEWFFSESKVKFEANSDDRIGGVNVFAMEGQAVVR